MASKSFGSEIARRPSKQNKTGGTIGEVNDLRSDVEDAFTKLETPGNGGTNLIAIDEWVDPAAAAVDGLEAATATVAAIRTVTTFEAAGIAALAAGPRNISFTTAGVTPADAPANAVVTGTDVNDAALTETVTVPQTAATGYSAKCFKTLTSVVYPAADGTAATVAIGFGPKLGLHSKIKTRAGLTAPIVENEAGVVVTTGTFEDAATSPPNGSYTPATAADGANDYALTYERDLS